MDYENLAKMLKLANIDLYDGNEEVKVVDVVLSELSEVWDKLTKEHQDLISEAMSSGQIQENKYVDENQWVVERRGVYWTDYLGSEEECLDEIKSECNRNNDNSHFYNYRLMTDKDIEEHYPETVNNLNSKFDF